jgi:Peptidoglycan-binding protein, CsiV
VTTRAFLLFASLVAARLPALGQEVPAAVEPPPPPPQYKVEIIVFANRDFDRQEERFDREPARDIGEPAVFRDVPRFDETVPLGFRPEGTAPNAAGDTPELASEFRFRILAPEELELDSEYRKIERLDAYVPLLHAGWIQPGLPEDQARPFDLGLLGARNPVGTVRVHLARFLHVTLDLTYQGPAPASAAGAESTALGPFGELAELRVAPRYRLVTGRQARSGELHYFDHPAFGVLVKITPAPEAPPDPLTGRGPAA